MGKATKDGLNHLCDQLNSRKTDFYEIVNTLKGITFNIIINYTFTSICMWLFFMVFLTVIVDKWLWNICVGLEKVCCWMSLNIC